MNWKQVKTSLAFTIFLIATALFALSGCKRSLSDTAKLKRGDIYSVQNQSFHSSVAPYRQPPFCCIYVGLTTNEANHFEADFQNLANGHDIHKVTKYYPVYSGGPLANYMSDSVAFFVFPIETPYLIDRHNKFADPAAIEQAQNGDWRMAFWFDVLWPTNASNINESGHDSLAPYTGRIQMVSYDSQYSTNDFKALAESIESAARKNWPGRKIGKIIFYGSN